MSEAVRYVEEKLPASYLYRLGVYAQSCAQIEYYICSAICISEGLNPSDEQWLPRHDTLRVSAISSQISELKKCSARLEAMDPWKKYFEELTGWLSRENVDARHLAIHGRHYQVGSTFYINAQPKDHRLRETPCTMNDIETVLKNADAILRALVSFCETSTD
ncbi:hypothetical protein [uncultured Tateyamaria sp.]|uniref:hypothetical protein n=1 Tax=uncultured Tateyamaria sp. TaxID=455651 RepID=UPI00262A704F|nr:hypothetical protein [uncultured Tateyamaria sp.]